MAKTIATIGGTALAPGVSKNARLYTKEAIARAVERAQGQLAGGKTLSVLTHHEAGDDSERIIGRITSMSLDENGAARFTADLADTPHARTIASLADNTSGQPFLSGMSIRGAWVGKVQRVKGPTGDAVETGDDLEFYGIDPTHKPGVEAAGVDAFAWAKGGATETTERVLITESVQEALVTAITEETAPAEVTGGLLPERPHVLAGGLCATCQAAAAEAKAPYGSAVPYADPGYLDADGKPAKGGNGVKRYPIDAKHVRAAWSYINQAKNAAQYTSNQLKRIKGRIRSAMSRIGAKVTDEGWVIWPAEQVTETLAEYYDGAVPASAAGSFRICATNGPLTVELSSYCIDPADLEVILCAAAQSASDALKAMDPDMDGDIDLDGVGPGSDTDGDAGGGADTTDQFDNDDGTADLTRRIMAAIKGESAESLDALIAEARAAGAETRTEVSEASPVSPAASPDAASQEGDPAVSETTTQEAAGQATAAPTFTQADITAAVAKALDEERAARKAKRKAAARAAESAKPAKAPVTETAQPAGEPDIQKLVNEGIAAALQAQGLVETTEQKVARLVEEGLTRAKQEMTAAGGGPGRKGLVAETGTPGAGAADAAVSFMKDGKVIPMEQWSEEQRRDAGMALQTFVLGNRAVF